MKRLLLILSLAVVAGATLGAGVRSATTAVERSAANPNGAVVFASNRDGDSDLYAVNMDGTGLTRLTNEPADESEPLPSPDGRHILFEGDEGPQVMEADGSGRRALHSCSFSPEAWSSDSRHIVCSNYEEGVIVIDTVDGTFTRLSDMGSTPSWSPDGTTIAYVDEYKLFVVPATGGARRRLGIRKLEEFAAPAWSPNSQRLAYVSADNENRDSLWTIRSDGSGGRRVAQKVSENTPSWSPDASRIAFMKEPAHYTSAVYVVGSDGRGSHEVSKSLAGEYVSDPSWSADGHVLYARTRFRSSDESDIYAVSPTGRGGRALTHPFPTGGTNVTPRWMTGMQASGVEQSPLTVAVPLKRKVALSTAVVWTATDGTRAVPRLAVDEHPRLTIWNGATGRARRGPLPCGGLYGPEYLALAGDRLAWTCSEAGNTYYAVQVMTAHAGDRRGKTIASASGDPNEGGDDIIGLVGHGGSIVFSNQHKNDLGPSDPWVVLTHKAKKCPGSDYYPSRSVCRPLGGRRGMTTAVDGGRVVTATRAGVVRTLSLGGRVLHSWSLGQGVLTALLRGRVLAVQHGATVDAYDAKTGAKRQSRELQTDGGPSPLLLGVQGDLVVYRTGGAIHMLRLSDGRDKALLIPGAAPWLDASLEPGGLFVSWNKMHDRRPGRIGFIPLRAILARL
jgi:TolB protein